MYWDERLDAFQAPPYNRQPTFLIWQERRMAKDLTFVDAKEDLVAHQAFVMDLLAQRKRGVERLARKADGHGTEIG